MYLADKTKLPDFAQVWLRLYEGTTVHGLPGRGERVGGGGMCSAVSVPSRSNPRLAWPSLRQGVRQSYSFGSGRQAAPARKEIWRDEEGREVGVSGGRVPQLRRFQPSAGNPLNGQPSALAIQPFQGIDNSTLGSGLDWIGSALQPEPRWERELRPRGGPR